MATATDTALLRSFSAGVRTCVSSAVDPAYCPFAFGLLPLPLALCLFSFASSLLLQHTKLGLKLTVFWSPNQRHFVFSPPLMLCIGQTNALVTPENCRLENRSWPPPSPTGERNLQPACHPPSRHRLRHLSWIRAPLRSKYRLEALARIASVCHRHGYMVVLPVNW